MTLRLLLTLMVIGQSLAAQSWKQIGPDSLNWQTVRSLTGRWISPSQFDLAASTDEGIAICSSAGKWNYALPNRPGSPPYQGTYYTSLIFSPWDPDSCFVGFEIADIEPIPHLVTSVFPPVYQFTEGLSGTCFFGKLTAIIPHGSDSTLYVGICGMEKSTDRGRTWNDILPADWTGWHRLVGCDAVNPDVIYRSWDSSYTLFRTMNGGVTWDSLLHIGVSSIVARGDTILAGVQHYPSDTSSSSAVLRSTDRGAHWLTVFTGARVVQLTLASPRQVVFAATGGGILRSTNWGMTWNTFNDSLPTELVTGLVVDPYADTVYVSTASLGVLKVWQTPTGVEEGGGLPVKFILHQNYPNPFNPSTVIAYDVPTRGWVSLAVFDVLGREVARLVAENKQPGEYSVTWNAEAVPSGIYFCRLIAGDFVQTKKMVLMR